MSQLLNAQRNSSTTSVEFNVSSMAISASECGAEMHEHTDYSDVVRQRLICASAVYRLAMSSDRANIVSEENKVRIKQRHLARLFHGVGAQTPRRALGELLLAAAPPKMFISDQTKNREKNWICTTPSISMALSYATAHKFCDENSRQSQSGGDKGANTKNAPILEKIGELLMSTASSVGLPPGCLKFISDSKNNDCCGDKSGACVEYRLVMELEAWADSIQMSECGPVVRPTCETGSMDCDSKDTFDIPDVPWSRSECGMSAPGKTENENTKTAIAVYFLDGVSVYALPVTSQTVKLCPTASFGSPIHLPHEALSTNLWDDHLVRLKSVLMFIEIKNK